MSGYRVHVRMGVSAAVDVEADTPEDALEFVYDAPGMPGGITVGAFGADVDEEGEWEAVQVTDESGEVVWSEPDDRTVAIVAELRRLADEFGATDYGRVAAQVMHNRADELAGDS